MRFQLPTDHRVGLPGKVNGRCEPAGFDPIDGAQDVADRDVSLQRGHGVVERHLVAHGRHLDRAERPAPAAGVPVVPAHEIEGLDQVVRRRPAPFVEIHHPAGLTGWRSSGARPDRNARYSNRS